MRSSITVLFLTLAVTLGSAAPFKATSASDAIYNVYYKSSEVEMVKVTILNDRNKIVFTETIHSSGFKRPYNFRELPEGQYTVVLSGKTGKQVQIINHKKVVTPASIIRVSPVSADRYLLSIANATEQHVWIRIYHNAIGLIHEETVVVNGSSAQIYNLAQVPARSKSAIQFEIVTENGQVVTSVF